MNEATPQQKDAAEQIRCLKIAVWLIAINVGWSVLIFFGLLSNNPPPSVPAPYNPTANLYPWQDGSYRPTPEVHWIKTNEIRIQKN